MIHSSLLQSLAGCLGGLPPARDDYLRVDLLGDEELGFLKDKTPGVCSFGNTVEKNILQREKREKKKAFVFGSLIT